MDDAWGHDWESVRSALADVDDELAVWQSPAYAMEEREEGWPAPGTIHWHVAHLAHCKRYYREVIAARGVEGRPPEPERAPGAGYAESCAELEAAHAALRAEIASLDPEELEMGVGNGMSADRFIAMATRHDVWHGAQVAVVKRLARTR